MTVTTINLRELAVEIDTILATLHGARRYHERRRVWAADALHRTAGHKKTGVSIFGNIIWDHDLSDAIAVVKSRIGAGSTWHQRELDEYDIQCAAIYQIDLEAGEANAVYSEYEWNRAFLVTNSNGHVHNGMSCSTCFPTTEYEWLTHYSAAEEDEIVKAAGELACTVCYPTAPSDYLNRPADLVSKTRQEKDAAAAQRAIEKAAREAKRIAKAATKSGDDLIIPSDWEDRRDERIASEATARREWNSDQDDLTSTYVPEYDWAEPEEREQKRQEYAERIDQRSARQRVRQSLIESALADKHDTTPEAIREDLLKRYAKRRPR